MEKIFIMAHSYRIWIQSISKIYVYKDKGKSRLQVFLQHASKKCPYFNWTRADQKTWAMNAFNYSRRPPGA